MQTNRPIRHDAATALCLFFTAIAPWLFVLRWQHIATDLAVGILVASCLAMGGTALGRTTRKSSRPITAGIPTHPMHSRASHHLWRFRAV